MDRPSDAQTPSITSTDNGPLSAAQKTRPPSWRTLYLILYNFTSAVLWSAVFGRVVLIAAMHGTRNLHVGVGELVKWTQTLAALEVVHSLFGLVRAPILTTIMQVASRFLLVWGIVYFFPGSTTRSPAYATMLLAWSTTEVIRYTYFAVNLAYGSVSKGLVWLRYNTFFVLYPMGISSECWLVWLAIPAARRADIMWEWALRLVLFIYVPGAYVLFTHMMAQRRKVLRGSAPKKTQ